MGPIIANIVYRSNQCKQDANTAYTVQKHDKARKELQKCPKKRSMVQTQPPQMYFFDVKLFPKAQAVWTQQPHLSQSIQNICLAVTPSGSCLLHNLHRVSSSEFDSSSSTQNRAGSCLVHLGLWLILGSELSTTASSESDV